MRPAPFVLIVDDDPISAKRMATILAEANCGTRVVTSAEDALVALQDDQPDAIVLDLVLPLMSGLLFAQQLAANPQTRSIPVVAVTAFAGPETERVVREAGVRAYVRKPFDVTAFAHQVLALLRRG